MVAILVAAPGRWELGKHVESRLQWSSSRPGLILSQCPGIKCRKMRKNLTVLCCFLVLAAACAQAAPEIHFDGKSWWGHVKVLAADDMEGRETGSPGLRKAEAYIVEQLKQAGLQPAGTNGFYQPVKFVSRRIVEKDSSASLVRNGKTEPLVLGEDVIFSTRVDLAPEVEAPLVFVGYGLSIPEKNYDDLAGLDLKGKVAVLFSGSPAEMPGPLASHTRPAKKDGRRFGMQARSGSFPSRTPQAWTSLGRASR